MCGRFSLAADKTTLSMTFPGFHIPEELPLRYNIAPTQPVAVVPNTGLQDLEFYRWGLIPFWAKDPAIGNKLINARGESLHEKPSFKHAFKRRRCMVLADGFYEWYKIPGGRTKIPVRIQLRSGKPFAFAGLWESWQQGEESPVHSCTIITTAPNSFMEKIHNRMPVILNPTDYDMWLDPEPRSPGNLSKLLKPCDPDAMIGYPVSTLVNNPQMDTPECIEAIGDGDFLES